MTDAGDIETTELLRHAREGDRNALEQLLQRYRPELLKRIRLMMGEVTRRTAESGDFLQGALVEVMRDLARVRHEAMLESFALARGLFEARGRPSAETPSQNVMRAEQLELLVEALARLRDEHRLAIELRWFQGLSFAEIARRTGRTAQAARKFHARALLRLGDELEKSQVFLRNGCPVRPFGSLGLVMRTSHVPGFVP